LAAVRRGCWRGGYNQVMSDPARPAASSAATVDGAAGRARAPRVLRNVLTVAAVLVAYYAAPVAGLPSGSGLVLSTLGLVAGVALLAWAMVRQAQRLVRRRPGDESVRLEGLVLLLYVVVPVFALGFFALEQADADQFADLETKTDALYFATSTLATVGFGDVHATGQLARALVTIQIAFNLVFVGALGSVLVNQIRQRAAARRTSTTGPDT
jgi:voltage-gated potassium channel